MLNVECRVDLQIRLHLCLSLRNSTIITLAFGKPPAFIAHFGAVFESSAVFSGLFLDFVSTPFRLDLAIDLDLTQLLTVTCPHFWELPRKTTVPHFLASEQLHWSKWGLKCCGLAQELLNGSSQVRRVCRWFTFPAQISPRQVSGFEPVAPGSQIHL